MTHDFFLRCEDIDDCALLLYGCLALGRALENEPGSSRRLTGESMTWPCGWLSTQKAYLDDLCIFMLYHLILNI